MALERLSEPAGRVRPGLLARMPPRAREPQGQHGVATVSFVEVTAPRHPLEQRRRRLKRVFLRPFAPLALRIGRGRVPVPLRTILLRKVALPYLRAKDEPFERRVGHGVFLGRTTDMLSLYVFTFGVWEPHL